MSLADYFRPGDGSASRIAAPQQDLLPLDAAKAQLNLAGDASHDGEVIGALYQATQLCEEWTERAFITQTWEWWLPCFPRRGFVVPRPPLQSVTHIKYTDDTGAEQTLATSVYRVVAPSGPACTYGTIDLAYGETWPLTRPQRDAVRIRFVAGYGAAVAVPEPIKGAVKLLLGDAFENREAQFVGTIIAENVAVMRLLSPYMMRTF